MCKGAPDPRRGPGLSRRRSQASVDIEEVMKDRPAVSLEVNRGWTVGLVAAVGLEDGTGGSDRLSGITYANGLWF